MAQQQEFMRQQQEMFRQAMAFIHVQVPPNPEIILDSLANNIKEFRFDPEANITFAGWYARYDDLFLKDAMRLDDEAKVRLLLRKLGTPAQTLRKFHPSKTPEKLYVRRDGGEAYDIVRYNRV